MSLLMFSDKHLEQAISGEKTQTRRLWDDMRLSEGNSYRAVLNEQGSMFTPREDAPAYVVVLNIRKEELGAITPEDADAEGNYTVSEFKSLWETMHGEWVSDQQVYVVEFECYEDDPRTDEISRE